MPLEDQFHLARLYTRPENIGHSRKPTKFCLQCISLIIWINTISWLLDAIRHWQQMLTWASIIKQYFTTNTRIHQQSRHPLYKLSSFSLWFRLNSSDFSFIPDTDSWASKRFMGLFLHFFDGHGRLQIQRKPGGLNPAVWCNGVPFEPFKALWKCIWSD